MKLRGGWEEEEDENNINVIIYYACWKEGKLLRNFGVI